MQHLEGMGTPVLYIGRTVLKGYMQKAVSSPEYADKIYRYVYCKGVESFHLK